MQNRNAPANPKKTKFPFKEGVTRPEIGLHK